jgi:hypothetical protein
MIVFSGLRKKLNLKDPNILTLSIYIRLSIMSSYKFLFNSSLTLGMIQGLLLMKAPYSIMKIILSGFSGGTFGLFAQGFFSCIGTRCSLAFISLQALSIIFLLR